MIYIGIDPGKNGGIACISDNKNSGEAYPYSDDVLINNLGFIYTQGWQDDVICYLEHVHAMPKQGVSSTFNFGMNFGFIQGVLKAYEIPYELVTPQKWTKEFCILVVCIITSIGQTKDFVTVLSKQRI